MPVRQKFKYINFIGKLFGACFTISIGNTHVKIYIFSQNSRKKNTNF